MEPPLKTWKRNLEKITEKKSEKKNPANFKTANFVIKYDQILN